MTIRPAAILPHEVSAVRAVIAGTADATQQKLASDWLMREAAQVQDNPYIANSERPAEDTIFHAGRMYTGQLWRAMLRPATMDAALLYEQKIEAARVASEKRRNK